MHMRGESFSGSYLQSEVANLMRWELMVTSDLPSHGSCEAFSSFAVALHPAITSAIPETSTAC